MRTGIHNHVGHSTIKMDIASHWSTILMMTKRKKGGGRTLEAT